jgi:CRP/FNR family transcriptional regulator
MTALVKNAHSRTINIKLNLKIMTSPAKSNPLDLYPALAQVSPTIAELGLARLDVPSGSALFTENSPCQGFPLVLDGEIKVSRSSGDGRSLELYRVVPGDLCLVSSASLFRTQPLSANGITTKASSLLLISPDVFRLWLEAPGFRNEVLGLFAERMADLTSLIDAVAFHKLDRRLAAALLGHGPQLAVTHQALADELGTVREIVTRLLRRFEREGWVTLGREQIQISDGAALRAVASSLPG